MENVSIVLLLTVCIAPLLCVAVPSVSTGPAVGAVPSNFKVSVQATTVDSNYSISLQENTGTLNVRGKEYTAFAYWTQVMGVFNGDGVWWINVVGVANDGSNLAIVYLDCTSGVLHDPFWEEDWNTFLFDEPMKPSNVSQSCNFELVDWNVPLSFPSLNALPESGFPTGITIQGDNIMLDNDLGWFIYNGNNYTVIPISTVNCFNCATNCGSYSQNETLAKQIDEVPYEYGCYPGPWYEIHHAAYLEGDPDTVCFGIFYLFRQDHSFLQWNYTFCMPELTSPMVLFDAEWSGRLQGNSMEQIKTKNFLKTNSQEVIPQNPMKGDINVIEESNKAQKLDTSHMKKSTAFETQNKLPSRNRPG